MPMQLENEKKLLCDDGTGSPTIRREKRESKLKLLIFLLQICFVVTLLIIWLSSDSIQASKNLWVLFFYNFPSQFIIATVPHEPVFLYFSKYHSPVIVTLVAIIGTLLTEILNYSWFKYIVDLKKFEKIEQTKFLKKVIDTFDRAPFLALWVAGFTPIPFYPFRFLVVFARYPMTKYLLAVFTSRTPRFYLLALLGSAFTIPDYWLLIIFIVLIVVANFPIIRSLIKNRGKIFRKQA